MMRVLFLAAVLVGMVAGMVTAQASAGSQPASQAASMPGADLDLEKVADWVGSKGTKSFLPGFAAKALGLGVDDDIPTVRLAYDSDIDKMTHVVGIFDKHMFIGVQQKNRTGVLWLTSRTGELKKTIAIREGTSAEVLPNDSYAKAFAGQKKFFNEVASLHPEGH